jgi:hypothetical protein
MNKKRIAKEWLLFLGCFFFGLLALPFLLFLFIARGGIKLSEFYSALVDKRDALTSWLVVIFPYLLVQLVRSAVWAWKTARNK